MKFEQILSLDLGEEHAVALAGLSDALAIAERHIKVLRRIGRELAKVATPPAPSSIGQRQLLQSLGIHDLSGIPTNKRDVLRMTANFVVDMARDAAHYAQLGWNREALKEYAALMMQRADLTLADIHQVAEVEKGTGVVTSFMRAILGQQGVARRVTPPMKAKASGSASLHILPVAYPVAKGLQSLGQINAIMQAGPGLGAPLPRKAQATPARKEY